MLAGDPGARMVFFDLSTVNSGFGGMLPLTYRNFGDHESLLVNHSVLADARIGVRWYEVRGLSGTPTIFQQSTFAPTDALWRWMGSIAMDHSGDIAVGYSTSSPSSFP